MMRIMIIIITMMITGTLDRTNGALTYSCALGERPEARTAARVTAEDLWW